MNTLTRNAFHTTGRLIYRGRAAETAGWAIAAGFVLWLMARSLAGAPVFCDSGYYLSVMRRMEEGARLYSDITFGYTPLFPYLLLGIGKLIGTGARYDIWLCLHFAVLTGVAAWIYLLARDATDAKRWGGLAAWLFLVSAFTAQADAVLPEAPSVFCGLAAVWLASAPGPKAWRPLAAGALCLASFGFKQYGLGFLPLCLWCTLTSGNGRWKSSALLAAGWMAAAALLYLTIPDTVSVIASSYGSDGVAAERYTRLGPLRYIPGACKVVFLRSFPVLLLALWPAVYRTKERSRWMILCLAGIIGFCGQFYFSGGEHYFQYVYAFAALGAALTGSWAVKAGGIERWGFAALTLAGLAWALIRPAQYTTYGVSKARQRVLAEAVCREVPAEAPFLVFNATHFGLYYLTDRRPPRIGGRYCYSYGPLVLTERLMLDKLAASGYILKVRSTSGWEFRETEATQAVCAACDTIYQDKYTVLLRHGAETGQPYEKK